MTIFKRDSEGTIVSGGYGVIDSLSAASWYVPHLYFLDDTHFIISLGNGSNGYDTRVYEFDETNMTATRITNTTSMLNVTQSNLEIYDEDSDYWYFINYKVSGVNSITDCIHYTLKVSKKDYTITYGTENLSDTAGKFMVVGNKMYFKAFVSRNPGWIIYQFDKDVFTNVTKVQGYEMQVRPTIVSDFPAVSESSGIGGGNGVHRDKVSIATIMSYKYGAWTLNSTGVSKTLFKVAYGAGLYVAVGADGTILTSEDKVTWTARTSGISGSLYRIVYAQNKFITIGDSGTILTSTDGITWTARTSGVTFTLRNIGFYNSRWIVTGASGTILTSTNGTTWTLQTSGVSTHLYGIGYGNGQYIVVGQSGTILTSTDAVTWTAQTRDTTVDIEGVAYGHGKYVAVGTNLWLESKDGINWESSSVSSIAYYDISADKAGFIAPGSSGQITSYVDGVKVTEVLGTSANRGVIYSEDTNEILISAVAGAIIFANIERRYQ